MPFEPRKSLLSDPDHWRKSAAEMRGYAELAEDDANRKSFLKLADEYDRLAARAGNRARSQA